MSRELKAWIVLVVCIWLTAIHFMHKDKPRQDVLIENSRIGANL